MIKLRSVTLARGSRVLLEDVSVSIHGGQRWGLIGANGSGKSSLLAALRGELHVDSGELEIPPQWSIAHVAQETPALERAALDYVMDGDGELRCVERALAQARADGDGHRQAELHARLDSVDGYSAPARAATLLSGLGFSAQDQGRSVSAFSGGWRVRLNLAQALMCRSDLLLLDEPTNHLDLEAVVWLEQWLRRYPGTMVLISHDREFLDGVVGGILHLERRKLTAYRGNYSAFEGQRSAALAQQQALFERQQREIAHLQRFVERFRAKATKARQAQSRVKALARMEAIAPAHVDSPFWFAFPPAPKAPNPLVTLRDVSAGYDERTILASVTVGLGPGSRVGLLGPNGAGKSTLVKLLAGEVVCRSGVLRRGNGLAVGYFAQHQLEHLVGSDSPLQHLRRLAPDALEQSLRDFLGGFDFSGDAVTQPVAPLSGGEKARLALALIVWRKPNLLLLDEPTNHLDLDMRHALTMALQAYEGAMVLVSHDRHLLATTADEFWLVANGTVRLFDGTLPDYQEWLSRRRTEQTDRDGTDTSDKGEHTAEARKLIRRREAQKRAAAQPLRKRIRELDAELARLAAELADIEEALADPGLYDAGQRSRLTELLQRRGRVRNVQEELETSWLESQEQLESLQEGQGADYPESL